MQKGPVRSYKLKLGKIYRTPRPYRFSSVPWCLDIADARILVQCGTGSAKLERFIAPLMMRGIQLFSEGPKSLRKLGLSVNKKRLQATDSLAYSKIDVI